MVVMRRKLYDLLGVPSAASFEEIRKAYLNRVRVVHPDRFNRAQQTAEWHEANSMLRELNEAYRILSDPERRARYDAGADQVESETRGRTWRTGEDTQPRKESSHSTTRESTQHSNTGAMGSGPDNRGFAQANSNTDKGTASDTRNSKNTAGKSNLGQFGIHRHWDDLPEAVRQRLLARQERRVTGDHWRFEVRGQVGSWAALGAFLIWLVWLSIWASAHPKLLWSSYVWTVPITACGAFLAIRRGGYLLRWRSSHLKPFFYASRLYFITDFDDVWFWQTADLQNLRMTDSRDRNYRSNCSNSIFQFEFVDWTQRVTLPKSKAFQFNAELKRWQRENEKAFENTDLDYMIAHDDFLALRGDSPILSTPQRAPARTRLVAECAVAVLAGFVLLIGVDRLNRLSPLDVVDSRPAQTADRTPNRTTSVRMPAPEFDTPAVVLQPETCVTLQPWSSREVCEKSQATESASQPDYAVPAKQAPTTMSSKAPTVESEPLMRKYGSTPREVDPCQASGSPPGQHRPGNGEELNFEQTREGHGELTIINGNSEDAAVIISNPVAEQGDRLIYVRAKMTAAMSGIPPGRYRMTFQIGRNWDDREENFQCVSATAVFDRPASFEEGYTEKGIEYSAIRVTLHKLAGGNARARGSESLSATPKN